MEKSAQECQQILREKKKVLNEKKCESEGWNNNVENARRRMTNL